jgi:poly(3-hydroxybutyrate) depolymerase
MAMRPGPSRATIWRRRLTAIVVLAVAVAIVALLVSAADSGSGSGGSGSGSSPEGKAEPGGYRLVHNEVQSKDVPERELGVNVIVPSELPKRGKRALIVYLHGRGGYEGTFNEAVLRGYRRLHGHGPLVVFPAGGVHGYWHNRAGGNWEDWVMDEVLPRVVDRYGVDPHKIAIGGISMGGFGALDIALKNPGKFCAVGGHSPALWFEGGETAPGAFDNLADFERNNVVRTVEEEPDAFGKTKVWIDYGEEDPFRVYDEGFVAALSEGDVDLTSHSWPGGHDGSYWGAHWPDYQRWYVKQLARCR